MNVNFFRSVHYLCRGLLYFGGLWTLRDWWPEILWIRDLLYFVSLLSELLLYWCMQLLSSRHWPWHIHHIWNDWHERTWDWHERTWTCHERTWALMVWKCIWSRSEIWFRFWFSLWSFVTPCRSCDITKFLGIINPSGAEYLCSSYRFGSETCDSS